MRKIKERNEPERKSQEKWKRTFSRDKKKKKKLLYLVKLFNDIILL